MQTLSATDLAIAVANERDTLTLNEREGRFGTFIIIADENGTIEVADSMEDAMARVLRVSLQAA